MLDVMSYFTKTQDTFHFPPRAQERARPHLPPRTSQNPEITRSTTSYCNWANCCSRPATAASTERIDTALADSYHRLDKTDMLRALLSGHST
jgi:hypothetical protein